MVTPRHVHTIDRYPNGFPRLDNHELNAKLGSMALNNNPDTTIPSPPPPRYRIQYKDGHLGGEYNWSDLLELIALHRRHGTLYLMDKVVRTTDHVDPGPNFPYETVLRSTSRFSHELRTHR